MTQYSYSFSNLQRDFKPVMKMFQERYPSALSLFTQREPVNNVTYYHYDDLEQPVSCKINNGAGYSSSDTELAVDNVVGTFAAGDKVIFKDANYEVCTVVSYSAPTLTVSALTASHADNVTILRVGTPKVQGSTASASDIREGTARTNYTQIFRYDINVAGSRLDINAEDYNDNIIQRGVMQGMRALYRDMATTAVFGTPVAASSGVAGQTTGLEYWLTQADAINTDEQAAKLTAKMINDEIENAYLKGGNPRVLQCSSQTARKIASFNTSTTNAMVFIDPNDAVAGANRKVSSFSGDLVGTSDLKVLVEPNMSDYVLHILDPDYLSLRPLNGRTLTDYDSTTAGFDGVERTIIGEYAIEIANPYYAHARIYNFDSSL